MFERLTSHNKIRVGAVTLAGAIALSGCGKSSPEAKKITVTETVSPAMPENCEWSNQNPRDVIRGENIIATVDGTCNFPPNAPAGIYASPDFSGNSIAQLENETPVIVECVELNGRPTRDDRGATSQSSTWVKVSSAEGKDFSGYISEVNLGYVNDDSLPRC